MMKYLHQCVCLKKILFLSYAYEKVIEYVQIKMFIYELDCEAKTLLIYLYDCSFIDSISGVTLL